MKIQSLDSLNDVENAIMDKARLDQPLKRGEAIRVLSEDIDLGKLVRAAEMIRERHFGKLVQIHVINNIKNGHCQEDCGYCAQRRGNGDSSIIKYSTKSEEEILSEAKAAYESGAHRYCLVTSGRGPSGSHIRQYAGIIRQLKRMYSMEICLSAGILTDPDEAAILAEAGLDRYNHNLNTSEGYYGSICTTHEYSERLNTLKNMKGAGISLCSGIIAGMGESDEDLVDASLELRKYGTKSIPVNFYLPVPGAVVEGGAMNQIRSLRILCMFRLMHPTAEIRIAAGREYYLGDKQSEALRVANSLFVSGYLNVKGSDASETVAMIVGSGFEVDTKYSELHALIDSTSKADLISHGIRLKGEKDLRPYRNNSRDGE